MVQSDQSSMNIIFNLNEHNLILKNIIFNLNE